MIIFQKLYPIVRVFTLIIISISVNQAQIPVEPPDPRSRAEVESVLSKAPVLSDKNLRDLHIVLLASEKDHGINEHDYPLWQKNWNLLLGGKKKDSDGTQINLFGPENEVPVDEMKEGAAKVKVSTAWEWPSKKQFKSADLIVAFSVVKWSNERNSELHKYLSRGGGFVTIHMSCVVGNALFDKTSGEISKASVEDGGIDLDDEVAELIGLSWNWDYTRWRHGPMNLDLVDKDHPICLGLPRQIYFMDEAYWPLHGDRSKVTTIASSKETIGNFKASKSVEAIQQKWPTEPTKDEPMFWAYEYGKGRVYGCILGHYSWTFDDPYFRILLLRGMAWAAGESAYRFDSLVLKGATIN